MGKYMSKTYRMNKHGIVVQTEKGTTDIESRAQEKFKDFEDEENMDPALVEFERSRREYINAMKRIRLENPDINPIELEMRAREEIMSKGPKSRAYYRLQANSPAKVPPPRLPRRPCNVNSRKNKPEKPL